jgi:hypothetical protein
LRECDVFVFSFPKSGRTWLTVMVGKALCRHYGYPVDDLLLHTFDLTKKIKAERDPSIRITGFGHDRSRTQRQLSYRKMFVSKLEFAEKDVVLLVRDPRDVVVSYYFEMSRREQAFVGSLSDFVRDERMGIRKIIAFHKNWYDRRDEPRSLRLLSYEDMRARPEHALQATLDAMGVPDITRDTVEEAVRYARFDNMRELERSEAFQSGTMQAADTKDPESFKVRRGQIGGYRDYLTDEDVAYVEECMQTMDYPFYRETARAIASESPAPVSSHR